MIADYALPPSDTLDAAMIALGRMLDELAAATPVVPLARCEPAAPLFPPPELV